MNHDGVATILATGGSAMVKQLTLAVKPAFWNCWSGNVPAYVHKDAKEVKTSS